MWGHNKNTSISSLSNNRSDLLQTPRKPLYACYINSDKSLRKIENSKEWKFSPCLTPILN